MVEEATVLVVVRRSIDSKHGEQGSLLIERGGLSTCCELLFRDLS